MTYSTNGPILLACLLLLVTGVDFATSQVQNCPGENYSPCSCDLDWSGTEFLVTCNRINMTEVRRVFASTSTTKLAKLSLTPSPSDQQIPADLLRGKQVTDLALFCPDRLNSPLIVNPAAFQSTQNGTYYLSINNCRLSQLNWSFLNGFNSLIGLSVKNCNNLHETFYTLPSLRSLSEILFSYVSDLNQLTVFPTLVNGLGRLDMTNCFDLNDTAADRILDWVTVTTSSSLWAINLSGNKLTRVPPQIASFSKIQVVNLFFNQIPMTISSGSFPFSVSNLYIDSSQINNIEPGAFQGDYSTSFVVLHGNKLTRFESGVFRSMLQQMSQSFGQLQVYDNPFDCTSDPCHLAWLVRDSPELLTPIWSAQCSNGTYFHQLSSSGFNSCP